MISIEKFLASFQPRSVMESAIRMSMSDPGGYDDSEEGLRRVTDSFYRIGVARGAGVSRAEIKRLVYGVHDLLRAA